METPKDPQNLNESAINDLIPRFSVLPDDAKIGIFNRLFPEISQADLRQWQHDQESAHEDAFFRRDRGWGTEPSTRVEELINGKFNERLLEKIGQFEELIIEGERRKLEKGNNTE